MSRGEVVSFLRMTATPPERAPGKCPECGGQLGEPVSGDVHCYVECEGCGQRYDLKDARIDLG